MVEPTPEPMGYDRFLWKPEYLRTVMKEKEKLRESDNIETGGVKFDAGKLRLDLVPPEGVEAVADILGVGAAKYAARNWEMGMDWSRPYGAALRHLFAWWNGEDVDKDSGRPHLWHVATNVFFLICYEKWKKGNDDRPV